MNLKYNSYIILFLTLSLNFYGQDVKIVNYKEFIINNSSIRALKVINNNMVWFAGSNGKYGRIINNVLEVDSIISTKNKKLHFRSIATNGKNIFILSIENPAILYKWQAFDKNLNNYKVVYKEISNKVFYDSMKFFDKKNGIAIGDPTEKCLSIITTNNGGKNWKKTTCNVLPPVFDGEAAFAASNTNIAIINNHVWVATGGKKARVFKSENMGIDWKVYDTPIVQGASMTGIYTIDFYDEMNGIIMGGNWENKNSFNKTKAITKDGGKTWNLIADNAMPGYISCVQYVPHSNGEKIIAVSTEGIFYSKNNGNSWSKISDKKFYTIQFSDNNTAWLSTNKKIAKIKLKYN